MVFSILEDSIVILYMHGLYTQTVAYCRGENLYAKRGNGYVRLYTRNATSIPKLSHVELILPEGLVAKNDGLGRLNLATIPKSKKVTNKNKK